MTRGIKKIGFCLKYMEEQWQEVLATCSDRRNSIGEGGNKRDTRERFVVGYSSCGGGGSSSIGSGAKRVHFQEPAEG